MIQLLFTLFLLVSPAQAQLGEPVIIRTQWQHPHFQAPTVSFYRQSLAGKMLIAGSGDLNHFDNYAGCTDILKKMFEYPLDQMRKDHYITEDFYQFLMRSPVSLDARQVVFLNTGKISGSFRGDGTSILPNLLGVFENRGANCLDSLKRFGTQWVDVDSSMWVVRGHVPEKGLDGKAIAHLMPWQSYEAFNAVSESLSKDGLHWEFGRAHKDPGTDFATAMKLGATTCAKDAIALGVPLHKGEVFFNVKNIKMAEHMQKAYGCVLRKAEGAHNFLLSANLSTLLEKLGPADFLHNQAEIKALFPHASAETLIQTENKISKIIFKTLDDVTAPAEQKGVFFYNGAHLGRVFAEFKKLDPHFFTTPKPASFNPFFSETAMSADRSARSVMRPGVEAWGVGDLSEASFESNPDYLERLIYQTFLLDRDVNRFPLGVPANKTSSYREVFMATESKAIAEHARSLGARVQEIRVDGNASSISVIPGQATHEIKYSSYYTLQFKPETTRKMIQDFARVGKSAGFREGKSQLAQDFLNSF